MNTKLADELLLMMRADQAMRTKSIYDPSTWDDTLDKHHTSRMKDIVGRYGWPSISLVGNKASHAAWLLVQHADHDPDFQEKCLNIMKGMSANEVSLSNIAYLEDRVLTSKGKPQLYGTQFQGVGKRLRPQPIENEAELHVRRKKMGLEPFEEYVRLVLDAYETRHMK